MAGRPRIPIEIRFWPKVAKRSLAECWPWIGSGHGKGYGGISVGGRSIPAHRVSYIIAHGDPGPLFVLHRCDNPICVNPEHLFTGTHQDNMDDMKAKGRGRNG